MMEYYKDSNNDVYAFELDGSQDHLITEDMTAVSNPPTDKHQWIDGKWALPIINYSTVSKLKLKRKLEQITEEGETDSLWVKLRALMIANPDMWDEWIIAGDIDIDDTMSVSAYTAMGKDKPWMQNLINEINTQQS